MKAFHIFALILQAAGCAFGIAVHSVFLILWCGAFGIYSAYRLSQLTEE